MAAATALIFVAVLHRYGAGSSIDFSKWANAHGVPVIPSVFRGIYSWLAGLDLSWAQELCIYMFIWMAKFVAAYGVRTGIHVGVDVLVNVLDPRYRKRVILFGLSCGALFTFVVALFGASFVDRMFLTGQQSNDLEAPMWIVYLAIPLGSGLMCFRFLQVTWAFYRTGELPHHDAAQVEGMETDPLHPADVAHEPARRRDERSPLALILIAEVCHAERKEEHIEELLGRGHTMATAMANFLDNYAKLGRKLGESVSAFNGGAAMTTSHGQVWQQVMKPLSELAPSREIDPKIKELEPPRDDIVDLAERYRSTGEEMRRRASDAA